MSRLKLKKALAELDEDQLRELILQVYEARKEAKEYLDFFITPDIHSKFISSVEEISKEVKRQRRHVNATRISRIRSLIKLFITYGPEEWMIAKLYYISLVSLVPIVLNYQRNEAFAKSVLCFFTDYLKFVDQSGQFTKQMPSIIDYIEGIEVTGSALRRRFKEQLQEIIRTFSGSGFQK